MSFSVVMEKVKGFSTLTAAVIFGYWAFGRQLGLSDIHALVVCSLVGTISCSILGTPVLQFLVNWFVVALIFSPLFILDWNAWYQTWPWPVYIALFGTVILSSLQLLKPPQRHRKNDKY